MENEVIEFQALSDYQHPKPTCMKVVHVLDGYLEHRVLGPYCLSDKFVSEAEGYCIIFFS